jgi:hypothetical protein
MIPLQSRNSSCSFKNKLAVTIGNGSSFNTSLFNENRRTGGAECFPKKNTDPNCRPFLCDGSKTLNRVVGNGSSTPHSGHSSKLSIDCNSLSLTKLQSKTSTNTRNPSLPLMGIQEASEAFRLSRNTLNNWIPTSHLKRVKIGARTFLPKVEIERIFKNALQEEQSAQLQPTFKEAL